MNWRGQASRWLDRLLPLSCVLCGAPGLHAAELRVPELRVPELRVPELPPLALCGACLADLPANTTACRRCALPLPSGVATQALLCGQCQQRPASYDRIIAPWRYESPLDYLVQELKFRQRLPIARLLGQLLLPAVLRCARPQVLIPVPLHARRLRQRGFNQAVEIARPVARRLAIPLRPQWAKRVNNTCSQSLLPVAERKTNVSNAFSVRLDDEAIHHVAIVDDVVTTTSTVDELARVLRLHGVKTVQVWSCARTGLD